jgi:hypothetical protein
MTTSRSSGRDVSIDGARVSMIEQVFLHVAPTRFARPKKGRLQDEMRSRPMLPRT